MPITASSNDADYLPVHKGCSYRVKVCRSIFPGGPVNNTTMQMITTLTMMMTRRNSAIPARHPLH